MVQYDYSLMEAYIQFDSEEETMEQKEFEFAKQYNQIITGLNRIRYLKNKQDKNHSKITDHLLKVISSMPNSQNTINKRQDTVRSNRTINNFNLSTMSNNLTNSRDNSKRGIGMQMQQSSSLSTMRIYSSQQGLNRIKKIDNNKPIVTRGEKRFESTTLIQQKGTDITQDHSPLLQNIVKGGNLSNLQQPRVQKIKLKQLMLKRSMNYHSMRQRRRLLQQKQKETQKQEHARVIQQKERIDQQKISGRKKIEDHYFDQLEKIHQEKRQSRSKRLGINKKQSDEVVCLQQRQLERIQQFEKSLLMEDQLKLFIQKQYKEKVSSNSRKEKGSRHKLSSAATTETNQC